MADKSSAPGPDAEAEKEEGEAAPKRSLKKLIIMAVGGLAVLGSAGGGYFFFFGGKPKEEQKAAAPVAKPPAFIDMPEVLVNLAGTGPDRTHYLKVKIVLEVADAALIPQIQPMLPRVVDAFQVFLRELRPTDLEGSAGTYRLKEELTRRVNVAIAPSRINAVLFKEMVMQ
jgi:flagellar FliL protein